MEELPATLLMYIVMCRTESDRHPFFSSKREFFEEWIKDKRERHELGWKVRNKMVSLIKEAEKRAEEAENKAERLEHKANHYDTLIELLRSAGINTSLWGWEDELVERLKSGVAKQVRMAVDNMARQLANLQKIVGNGI